MYLNYRPGGGRAFETGVQYAEEKHALYSNENSREFVAVQARPIYSKGSKPGSSSLLRRLRKAGSWRVLRPLILLAAGFWALQHFYPSVITTTFSRSPTRTLLSTTSKQLDPISSQVSLSSNAEVRASSSKRVPWSDVIKQQGRGGKLFSNTPEQPSHKVTHEYFTYEEFEDMKQRLVQSRLVTSSYSALESGDTALANSSMLGRVNGVGISGAVFMFSAAGEPSFRAHAQHSDLGTLLDCVRVRAANAFVVRVLREPAAGDGAEFQGDGLRMDDTLLIRPEHRDKLHPHPFVAHETSVFFLSVPSDGTGGEYVLGAGAQEVVVPPEENTILTFRGDTPYRVRRLASPSHASRLSVVIEQYIVPPEYEHTLHPYWSSAPAVPKPYRVPVPWDDIIEEMGREDTDRIFTNTPDQPLYVVKHNFFEPDVFLRIKREMGFGPLSLIPNALDADNFGSTSGAVVMLNSEGEAQLRADAQYYGMAAFLDRVRIPGANAFVFNILRAESGKTVDDPESAAGNHWDDTLELRSEYSEGGNYSSPFVSHQTTVVYLSVPEDMSGGHYVMTPNINGIAKDSTTMQPEENMMMAFRGDAEHHVQRFHTNTGKPRVTLVVEQYIVPPEFYHMTIRWSSTVDGRGRDESSNDSKDGDNDGNDDDKGKSTGGVDWPAMIEKYGDAQRRKIFSTTPAQPLYTVQKGFFANEQFEAMKQRLAFGPLSLVPNTLNTDNFGTTSGVVLGFNSEGEAQFRRDPLYADFVAFLDRIRIPGANAFVMNILRAESERSVQDLKFAAGTHWDDTLKIKSPFFDSDNPNPFVSHQTTVIYLSVPEDMTGGLFVMAPRGIPNVKEEEIEVHPEENMMMAFRGDAQHHVQRFHTNTSKPRVTLVIEQYLIPKELEPTLYTWWSSEEEEEEAAKQTGGIRWGSMVLKHRGHDGRIFTNTPEQTLYASQKDFFPKEQFEAMKQRVAFGPLAKVPNTLSADNFGTTSGVVLGFNKEGEAQLRADSQFEDFVAFLDKVRIPGANAFVMNVLRAESEASVKDTQAAAGSHWDDTLIIRTEFCDARFAHPFVSHQTTVIYLSVPEDMTGGHYVMTPEGIPNVTQTKIEIQPEENMMMHFRGDAQHRVQRFHTNTGKPRVTLVLEQYLIPQELEKVLHTWWNSAVSSPSGC